MALSTTNTKYEKRFSNITLYQNGIEIVCETLLKMGFEITINTSSKTGKALILSPGDDVNSGLKEIGNYIHHSDELILKVKKLDLLLEINKWNAYVSTDSTEFTTRQMVDSIYSILDRYQAHGAFKLWREHASIFMLVIFLVLGAFAFESSNRLSAPFLSGIGASCFSFAFFGSIPYGFLISKNQVFYRKREEISIWYRNKDGVFTNVVSSLIGGLIGYLLGIITALFMIK